MEVHMNTLAFTWSGSSTLAQQLSQPVIGMSIGTMAHETLISVVLWHSDGKGLQIRSIMHDIAEWVEVGVLDFTLVTTRERDETNIDVPASFGSNVKAYKLVITEAGTTAESGIVLQASDGQEIVIVAGVYPYSLAISSVSFMPHGFEPEYPLDAYARIGIS
jgi:hypothetical protein